MRFFYLKLHKHDYKLLAKGALIKLLFIFLLISFTEAKSQSVITIRNNYEEVLLAGNYYYYIDKTPEKINEKNVLHQQFKVSNVKIPFYDVGVNDVWIKFNVLNATGIEELYFDLRYSNLSSVTLYKVNNDLLSIINRQGNAVSQQNDSMLGPNFTFPLSQSDNTEQEYLLHIESQHPIIAPAYICTKLSFQKSILTQFTLAALFTGILLVMIIYNAFLFFAVQDKSYIIYVIYTISLLLAQLTIDGYMAKFIWPSVVQINAYAVVLTTNFTIISGLIFAINFLQIKHFAPAVRWLFLAVICFAIADIFLSFLGCYNISYKILNYNSLLTAALIFITAIYIANKGYKPAFLYLLAWISMLIALVLLTLRNINVLPYNNFTSHIVYIGAAIETTLLSFALADKINIYKKEKEESQADALRISKENEQLIQEQNVFLEKKITERTYDLEKTLRELKDAQIQLVESEKMASLGQLTAGIAHEINNPINFVKSNVSPLQMDIHDLFEIITEYQKLHHIEKEEQPDILQRIKILESKLDPDFLKEEIESLISGIEEGAERTAEIVRGLRNFSRLDESEMKEVNVYDNINSTLVLLRNTTPAYLKIRKHFEANSEIECYPGKLNQVFMNILTNCIQAIKAKPILNAEEYIDIRVLEQNDYMRIIISDTGIGMKEEVKHKIFDPFFTTKDVGEGTGLGMSIVFKIIEKHHGKIGVQSTFGEGSTFIIDIPYRLKIVAALGEEEVHS